MIKHGYNNLPGWTPPQSQRRGPNIFSENQATGTDALGNTDGFIKYQGEEILTSSTEWHYNGTKSIKVSIPGTRANEGAFVDSWAAKPLTRYGLKFKLNNPNGSNIVVGIYDQTWSLIESINVDSMGLHSINTTFTSGESLDAVMVLMKCIDAIETHWYADSFDLYEV